MALVTVKVKRGWVVVRQPRGSDVALGAGVFWMGIYKTKAEADADRRGIERWLREERKQNG